MKVLVFGWYDHGNLGDQLFIDAFKELFPDHNFVFTDHITPALLTGIEAVFIGGGSLIDQEPDITYEAQEILSKLPVLYIGIGSETEINSTHFSLMRRAKLIAVRTSANIDKIKQLNSNTIVIPDLVYSIAHKISKGSKIPKSVLYMPNSSIVPNWNDAHWKHSAWGFFKMEMAQTLDNLIERDYTIQFYPMCYNRQSNDYYAATEIINMMRHKEVDILEWADSFLTNHRIFSAYSTIISQRYHGLVLAEMVDTPYISIWHHDKLKETHFNRGQFIPYFETSKASLLKSIEQAEKQTAFPPIEKHLYGDLILAVKNALCRNTEQQN